MGMGIMCGRAVIDVRGAANLGDDVPDGLHVDGLLALLAALPQQFGYAMFDIVGDILSALAIEVALHALHVAVQQFVGILVYVIQGTKEID